MCTVTGAACRCSQTYRLLQLLRTCRLVCTYPVYTHTLTNRRVGRLFYTTEHSLMVGQWVPKHVAVCVLKHYCIFDEVCEFVCHFVAIKYIGSSLGIGVFFYFCVCSILTDTKLNGVVTHLLFTYMFQMLSSLRCQGYRCEWRRHFCCCSISFCWLAFWFKGSVFECDLDQACQTRIYFLGLLVWLVDCQSVHHLAGSSVLVDHWQLAVVLCILHW
jgi:hypothetical protein